MFSSLASAAGFTRAKKKFHFDVTFSLQDLLNCTYVTGVLFVKLRLKDGGNYIAVSKRHDIKNHCVRWDQVFEFRCKMVASHTTGELEPCVCKVSIRKEARGGRSYKKLGYVKINLAEYAGAGATQRKYLLESYNETKHKPDNSILKVTISLKQTSGDSVFKAPRAPVWELNETEDEGIQPDIHSSRLSSFTSHLRTPSSLSGGSVTGLSLGAGSLSLQDVRKRSLSGEEGRKPSSSVGSVREERIEETEEEEEVYSRHSSECITEEETQSTITPHSPPSENGTGDSQEKTPRNLSPSLRTTRSNSLGSGDHNMRPKLSSVTTETGVQSLPNRSQAHKRHTSFSGGGTSPRRLHRRNQSLLSGQSSKSTSAYSTLSERSMRSWESQDIESISGSTRKLAIVPTSSKVEQSRVDTMEVINKLLEGQTFNSEEQEKIGSKGLQLFVDKTRGTVTLGGSELDRKFMNLQAVDVTGTIVHSRSSSSGSSPRPPRRDSSSNNVRNYSPRESVSSIVTTSKPTK